ncbi:MAG: MAPEG family protein [Woeseiaceae bacterium]|nr:MAPEG family protein [Woeseiaceae bacterium]
MTGSEILKPVLAMMLLTLVVWIVLYVRRIAHMKANRIDAQQLTTPERAIALIPEPVNNPANNFKNLFELPVIFYALCLLLFAAGMVDTVYVAAAWLFVALRAVHSVIQCTANIVMARFLAYLAGAVVLWFMVLRAALQLF